jgi:Mrp family chromosome partitioning ATPase
VLSVIPEPARRQSSRDPIAIIRGDPVLRDAYRALRVRTELASSDVLDVAMLVTRPNANVGRTLPAALGLAVSLAMSGRQVVLVGADFAGRPLNQLFGTGEIDGLAEGLRNPTNWESALITTSLPGLLLLTEGADTDGAEELFTQQQLSRLFTSLRRSFADVIVIDGPPLVDSPDSLMFAEAATMVVLDVDIRRTNRKELMGALGHLGDYRERVVGAILSNAGRGFRRSNWVVEPGGLTRQGFLSRLAKGSGGSKRRIGSHGKDRTSPGAVVHWIEVDGEIRRMQARREGVVLTQVEDWSHEDISATGIEIESFVSDGLGAVGSRSWINRDVM